MKEANNNEVDLLLRSLARERRESVLQNATTSGDGEQVSSDHLDADELNSYAEGVVPAPARARYTVHLADCAACRSIVVGLTQAAGASTRYEVSEPQGGLPFWQKVTSLFSPPVLRYAVPALVLTAAIGIGLLALKQKRQVEFIAKNQPGNTSSESRPAPTPPTELQSKTSAGPQSRTYDEATKQKDLQDQKTPIGRVGEESTVVKAPMAKDAAGTGAGAGVVADSRPSYASEPKAEAPPPPAPILQGEKSAELAKEQPAKRDEQERSRDDFRNQSNDKVHGPNRSAAQRNSTSVPANGQVAGVMGARGPSSEKNKKAGDIETRTILGRRFTREGDAWVDTAYESSRATVRVRRDSEQFRALVADEPGIRTIANQLDGVVIVVWKNRAYRIQ
jgi:hypothetical protein